MPPESIVCDRNQLTSWTGLVSAYRRDEKISWLQISTDENTVESTEIDYFGEPDAANSYRIRGERFVASDWPRIEQSYGVLIEGMRATAWICEDDKTPPVIDWRPLQD